VIIMEETKRFNIEDINIEKNKSIWYNVMVISDTRHIYM